MSGFLDPGMSDAKESAVSDKYFVGVVKVNSDPEKAGRIKVMVPGLYEDYSPEDLPWCVDASGGGGAGNGEGSLWVPTLDSKVIIKLQGGDPHSPTYVAQARKPEDLPSVLKENYPHRVGIVLDSFLDTFGGGDRDYTHKGRSKPFNAPHIMFIDRSTGDMKYIHPTGSSMHFNPQGDITFYSVRDIVMLAERDFHRTARNRLFDTAGVSWDGDGGQNIRFRAARIDWN